MKSIEKRNRFSTIGVREGCRLGICYRIGIYSLYRTLSQMIEDSKNTRLFSSIHLMPLKSKDLNALLSSLRNAECFWYYTALGLVYFLYVFLLLLTWDWFEYDILSYMTYFTNVESDIDNNILQPLGSCFCI